MRSCRRFWKTPTDVYTQIDNPGDLVFSCEASGTRRIQAELYKRIRTSEGTFKEGKYREFREKPLLSSHIIAVGMKRDERNSLPEIEEIGAVYCAIENMYLTASAYGIGSYLSTGGITYFEMPRVF